MNGIWLDRQHGQDIEVDTLLYAEDARLSAMEGLPGRRRRESGRLSVTSAVLAVGVVVAVVVALMRIAVAVKILR